MNKLLFISFIVFFSNQALSQADNKILKSYQYTYSTNGLNIGNHIYIDYLKGAYFNAYSNRATLLKINRNLDVVDSICVSCLEITDKNTYGWMSIFSSDYGKIYSPFIYRNADSIYTRIIEIDTSFNQVRKFRVDIPLDKARYSYSFNTAHVIDSTIYLAGILMDTASFWPHAYIVQIDLNGHVLNSHIVQSDSVKYGPKLIYFESLFVNDTAVVATFYGTNYEYAARYDRNLNLESLNHQINVASTFGWNSHFYFVKNSKQTPLFQAISYIYDINYSPKPDENKFYKNLSLLRLNGDFQINGLDTFAYKGWKTDTLTFFIEAPNDGTASFGYASEDTVITMATDFFVYPNNWPIFQNNNQATITNISAQKSVNRTTIWSKIYQNGYSHSAEEIIALPNNEWLLVFNEYDWVNYGLDNLSIKLIKIDGNGNPIGITENEEIALTQEPIVYPNPASTQLTVGALHWPGNIYNYQLSDLKGACVQEGVLPETGQINLNQNLEGVYILTITNQTGFGWSRKIIIH